MKNKLTDPRSSITPNRIDIEKTTPRQNINCWEEVRRVLKVIREKDTWCTEGQNLNDSRQWNYIFKYWGWEDCQPKILCTGKCLSKMKVRTSLVVQRLGICLPVQGTWVWSLIQEDPPCHGISNPMHQTTEPTCCNTECRVSRACPLQQEKPLWPMRCDLREAPARHN